ncbi:MAG: hypothetical protein AAB758_02540, partial [Patescibacteria group bacterium]
PTAWFTWRRARRVAGFVLTFILSVNFLVWWGSAVDEHHPISSLRDSISSIAGTVYHTVAPYLATPVDILLGIVWFLGIALPMVAMFIGFGGTLWAIFSPNASRK